MKSYLNFFCRLLEDTALNSLKYLLMAAALKTNGTFCSTQQQQFLQSTRDQFLHGSSHSNFKHCKSKKTTKPAPLCVRATSSKVELDFNDQSWKQKFQEDWERRFTLPSITDIYDLKPRPTTFSLKKNRSHLPLYLALLELTSFLLLSY